MKCAKIVYEEHDALDDMAEWVGLVRVENGYFRTNRRCDGEVAGDDAAAGYTICPSCLISGADAATADIPKRLKLQVHIGPHKVREFSIFETHEPDMRSRDERQVPQSLRQSTKVVDEKGVDVSMLVSELRSGGWYIYRLRTARKQTGPVVEVSLAQRGYSKPPAALSRQAMEAIADELVFPAHVRVYRNRGYIHAEHGDISLHSVEIVRVRVGEDCTSRLRFDNGLWRLAPLVERPADEPAATPAATA